MSSKVDIQKQKRWQKLLDAVQKATVVNLHENADEKRARIAKLEANAEQWFEYYFPNFYSSKPAAFHINATKRILKNAEWYEVRAWSRELAKSTRSMMEDLFLLLTKKKRSKLLISNSLDNAIRLMEPYIVQLEANQRIIADYGKQQKIGNWTDAEITTKSGFSMRALGAGQSPRGTRKDEVRPDIIEFDDFDTDEECLNPDIIDKKWKWINEAVIPTRSISKATLIRWNGNLIAEDCCIQRARKLADYVEIVNIRNADGKSSWPNKNSEKDIDRVLSTVSFSAQQKEYYNNPHTEGKVFRDITWGKVPPLHKFPFLVVYADPATSNKDRGTGRTANNSSKAVFVVGKLEHKFYIISGFLDHVANAVFVDWLYGSKNAIGDKTQGYVYIENNTLQEPFYDQVLKPLIFEQSKKHKNLLPILPDTRKKPDKFFRIEGTLEPLNRMGLLVFNEAEKDNPHFQRLEAQFKSVSPRSKTMDGPDCIEGGVWIINNKLFDLGASIHITKRNNQNQKRY